MIKRRTGSDRPAKKNVQGGRTQAKGKRAAAPSFERRTERAEGPAFQRRPTRSDAAARPSTGGRPGRDENPSRPSSRGRTERDVRPARSFAEPRARRGEVGEEVKKREDRSNDRIYGINPVLEAFRAGRGIERLTVAEGRGGREITEIIGLARERNVKISYEPRESLSRLTKTESHQGVMAIVAAGKYSTLDEILRKAKSSGEKPFIIILDGIQDPQNLGAIIRSAVCAGAHGVVLPKDRAVGLTSTAEKASAGALSYMTVAKVTNISQTLEELKGKGFWIIGTDSSATGDLYSADFKGPIGLVIGSEGEGMRPLVAKKCDLVVSIPIKGEVSSLNASAAAAVMMYEAVRQRSMK